MNKKKNLILATLIFGFIFLLTSSSYAQLTGSNSGGPSSLQIENPIKADSLASLLSDILSIIVQIGVPILVIMIIFTGFLFVMAKGDPAKLKDAKKAIISVLVGSTIVLGAFAISQAIQNTVGELQGNNVPNLDKPAPLWD